jgi:hypothetical protein
MTLEQPPLSDTIIMESRSPRPSALIPLRNGDTATPTNTTPGPRTEPQPGVGSTGR